MYVYICVYFYVCVLILYAKSEEKQSCHLIFIHDIADDGGAAAARRRCRWPAMRLVGQASKHACISFFCTLALNSLLHFLFALAQLKCSCRPCPRPRVADYIGRKRTFALGAFVFVVGALLMALATSFIMLIAGRVVTGLGVGVLGRGKSLCVRRHHTCDSSVFDNQ